MNTTTKNKKSRSDLVTLSLGCEAYNIARELAKEDGLSVSAYIRSVLFKTRRSNSKNLDPVEAEK